MPMPSSSSGPGQGAEEAEDLFGRTKRDITRQIKGDEELEAIFKWPLYQASAVLEQKQRQRGRKIYSLHAPEVECIRCPASDATHR